MSSFSFLFSGCVFQLLQTIADENDYDDEFGSEEDSEEGSEDDEDEEEGSEDDDEEQNIKNVSSFCLFFQPYNRSPQIEVA